MDREDRYGVTFLLGFLVMVFALQTDVVSTWIVLAVAAVGAVAWLWRWVTAEE